MGSVLQWKYERFPKQSDWKMAANQDKMAPKTELKLHQQYFGMNNIKKLPKKCKRFPQGTYLYFSGRRSSVYGFCIIARLKSPAKGCKYEQMSTLSHMCWLALIKYEEFCISCG